MDAEGVQPDVANTSLDLELSPTEFKALIV
jgi:hypothetical protein